MRIPREIFQLLYGSAPHLSPPVSGLEDLYLYEKDVIGPREDTLWPELLHSFPAVKNFYLNTSIVPPVALLLQGRPTEFLPNLENIFLTELGPTKRIDEAIKNFVAARRLNSGHPIAVSGWDYSGMGMYKHSLFR
jgi:hypothetical protein